MIRWTPYIFLRLVFFLFPGILLQGVIQPDFFWGTLLIAVFGGLFWGLSRGLPGYVRIQFEGLFGLWAGLLVSTCGWLIAHQFDATSRKDHLLHQKAASAYVLEIRSEAQPRPKSIKFEGNVFQANLEGKWVNVTAKMIVYLRKDSLNSPNQALHYGDRILIKGTPDRIQGPRNPAAFDYAAYLGRKNIYYQDFVRQEDFVRLSQGNPDGFWRLALAFRARLTEYLQESIRDKDVLGVARALLLGNKADLEDEVRTAYANTGLMHILAVSGLHVGFIVLLLGGLLSRLKKLHYGKYLYLLLVLVGLWSYTFLTGLAPSVMRAATMFSFVLMGQCFGRRSLIYNTLGASAFFLLLLNPFLVYSVSFQLSYTAVLGIVYLQPKFYRLLHINHWLGDYFWALTCVSIAAQLATFPLGLYYFHQFPNYFLLSNLVVLPFVQLILYLGLGFLLTAFIPFLHAWLGFLFAKSIGWMNAITERLAQLPYAITEGVYLTFVELCLLYVVILGIVLLFARRKFYYLVLTAVVVFVFSASRLNRLIRQDQQQVLAVFETPGASALALIQGRKGIVLADSSLLTDTKTLHYSVLPLLDSIGLDERHMQLLQAHQSDTSVYYYRHQGDFAVLQWENTRFLLLSHRNVWKQLKNLQQLAPDFILIRKNAVRKLTAIHDLFPDAQIILDGSNSYYRSKSLEYEGDSLGVSVHATHHQGAFLLQK